jgi:hypothetical protein
MYHNFGRADECPFSWVFISTACAPEWGAKGGITDIKGEKIR